jgi:hypothetical protein
MTGFIPEIDTETANPVRGEVSPSPDKDRNQLTYLCGHTVFGILHQKKKSRQVPANPSSMITTHRTQYPQQHKKKSRQVPANPSSSGSSRTHRTGPRHKRIRALRGKKERCSEVGSSSPPDARSRMLEAAVLASASPPPRPGRDKVGKKSRCLFT